MLQGIVTNTRRLYRLPKRTYLEEHRNSSISIRCIIRLLPERATSRMPRARRQYIQPLYVRFITYPIGQRIRIEHPALPFVDCSVLRPPRLELCDRFTGLDPEIEQDFFSPELQRRAASRRRAASWRRVESRSTVLFNSTPHRLRSTFLNWSFPVNGNFLVVPIACTAGMHRSVAMAERLARHVSLWEFRNCRLRVNVEHTELWRCVEEDRRINIATRSRYIKLFEQEEDNIGEEHKIGDEHIIRKRYRQGHGISVRNVNSEDNDDDDDDDD